MNHQVRYGSVNNRLFTGKALPSMFAEQVAFLKQCAYVEDEDNQL